MDAAHTTTGSDIRAVIFDWAGTVVDFGSMAPAAAFVRTFAGAGIAVTDEEVRRPMGLEKRDHLRALLAMPEIAERWRAVRGHAPGDADLDELYAAFVPTQLATVGAHAVP